MAKWTFTYYTSSDEIIINHLRALIKNNNLINNCIIILIVQTADKTVFGNMFQELFCILYVNMHYIVLYKDNLEFYCVHFSIYKKYGTLNSLEGESNKSGIRFKDDIIL